jgi:hypothetical protein
MGNKRSALTSAYKADSPSLTALSGLEHGALSSDAEAAIAYPVLRT